MPSVRLVVITVLATILTIIVALQLTFAYYVEHFLHGGSRAASPGGALGQSPNYVTSAGFYDLADVKNSPRRSSNHNLDLEMYTRIESGDIVHVCTDALTAFATDVLPAIHTSTRFVLVTGDSDLAVTSSEIADDRRISHMFSQNCTVDHPKMTRIPIGMDFHTHESPTLSKADQNERLRKIALEAKPWSKRSPLIFCCVSISTNPDRAKALADIPASLVYVVELRLEETAYFKNMASYKYVFSPHGNGIDCHRTWEALALGCVPIVERSGIVDVFESLPVIVVDKWSDVTEELLHGFAKTRGDSTTAESEKKLTMEYWTRMILQNTVKESSVYDGVYPVTRIFVMALFKDNLQYLQNYFFKRMIEWEALHKKDVTFEYYFLENNSSDGTNKALAEFLTDRKGRLITLDLPPCDMSGIKFSRVERLALLRNTLLDDVRQDLVRDSWCLLIDSDIEFETDTLERLFTTTNPRSNNVGMLGAFSIDKRIGSGHYYDLFALETTNNCDTSSYCPFDTCSYCKINCERRFGHDNNLINVKSCFGGFVIIDTNVFLDHRNVMWDTRPTGGGDGLCEHRMFCESIRENTHMRVCLAADVDSVRW